MTQWSILEKYTKIPKKQFLKILNFCLNDEDTLYHQTYVMPMGNSLSPTIADIVLDKLLKETLLELKNNNIHIKLRTKYIDDLFAIIKRKDEDIILTTFNKYHNKLQFTIEKERDSCISYLDMKIYRQNKKISTECYTKPIASGRTINFHSTQPTKKINTTVNLITKSITLCDEQYRAKNINKVKEIRLMNSFPQTIINNLIRKTTSIPHVNNTINISGNPKNYYSLPYIPQLTKTTNLKHIIEDSYVTLAHRVNQTISTLFTNTETETKKSNVVREIK